MAYSTGLSMLLLQMTTYVNTMSLLGKFSPHTMNIVYSNVAVVYLNAVLSDLCHRRVELAKKMLKRKSMG